MRTREEAGRRQHPGRRRRDRRDPPEHAGRGARGRAPHDEGPARLRARRAGRVPLRVALSASGTRLDRLRVDRSGDVPRIAGCGPLTRGGVARRSVHVDDRRLAAGVLASQLAGDPGSCEYRIAGLDGTTRWLLDRWTCRREAGGDVIAEGIVSDVTVLREAQNDLVGRRLPRHASRTRSSRALAWPPSGPPTRIPSRGSPTAAASSDRSRGRSAPRPRSRSA